VTSPAPPSPSETAPGAAPPDGVAQNPPAASSRRSAPSPASWSVARIDVPQAPHRPISWPAPRAPDTSSPHDHTDCLAEPAPVPMPAASAPATDDATPSSPTAEADGTAPPASSRVIRSVPAGANRPPMPSVDAHSPDSAGTATPPIRSAVAPYPLPYLDPKASVPAPVDNRLSARSLATNRRLPPQVPPVSDAAAPPTPAMPSTVPRIPAAISEGLCSAFEIGEIPAPSPVASRKKFHTHTTAMAPIRLSRLAAEMRQLCRFPL
jgi:hypothetical protein